MSVAGVRNATARARDDHQLARFVFHPPGRYSSRQCVGDHLRGKVWLGREPFVLGHARQLTTGLVTSSGLGQVEAPVDERVPAG